MRLGKYVSKVPKIFKHANIFMHLEFSKYLSNMQEVSLPPLDYRYNEVSSIMHEEMLDLHYKFLHQGYINRYNKMITAEKIKSLPVKDKYFGRDKVLIFNLGGYLNHSLFWKSFSPKKSDYVMSDEMKKLFEKTFSNTKNFTDKILNLLPNIRGSGWIWLMYIPKNSSLRLRTTMNQNFPLSGIPLLNIDMWEHAYYLQYKVDKVKYVTNIVSTLNWKFASERLAKARKEGKDRP